MARRLDRTNVIVIMAVALLAVWPPSILLANGGDQRVVDGTYLINLSRAPFTPRVGAKTAFLASFVDLRASRLIADDLLVTVRIAKLGGIGTDKRTFLSRQDKLTVTGGVLEFSYTFTEPGLHEIFFDFVLASSPGTVYEAPDFLLDVQAGADRSPATAWAGAAAAGFAVGFLVAQFLRQRRTA